MEATKELNFAIQVKDLSASEPRTLLMIGSTESVDRDGDVLDVSGWKLEAYLKNPVVQWAHDYSIPPVATARSVYVDQREKKLSFKLYFPTIEELSSNPKIPSDHALFVDTIYNMYKNGFLNASSVGFRGLKSAPREDDADRPMWMRGLHFTEQELVELSLVPVPANAEALVSARSMKSFDPKGVEMIEKAVTEFKSVIPFHSYPLADEDVAWDAGKEVGAAEVEDLKKMCAWYDADSSDKKSAYKLPHHQKDGYKTVWRGVAAAMGAILGARGGVNIPDADKKGVYNHLAKHYKEFDKEAPEFKEYTPEELKAFEEEEGETMANELTPEEITKLKQFVASLPGKDTTEKSGARLSKASREKVDKAIEHCSSCLASLKDLADDGVVEPDEDSNDGVEKPKGTDLSTIVVKDGMTLDEAENILRSGGKEGV